jgi:hypothetical protein
LHEGMMIYFLLKFFISIKIKGNYTQLHAGLKIVNENKRE